MKNEGSLNSQLVGATVFRGAFHGLKQPCLRLVFAATYRKQSSPSADSSTATEPLLPLREVRTLNWQYFANQSRLIKEKYSGLALAVERCHELLISLQESAGWPVASGGVVSEVRLIQQGGCVVTLCMPSMFPLQLLRALPWLMKQLGDNREPPAALANCPVQLADLLNLLSRTAPSGTNTRLLLKAAHALGVPVQTLSGSAMLYGWGCRARWMESSFTDATSGISARLARDKVVAHMLLQRAGFPVAEQVVAPNVESAVAAAGRMGYPVVIKPSDLDGGRGVEAGLLDEASLRTAYARSSRFSKKLILEKHIAGKDFRLGVLNGELTWATYREPAGVWGDGVSMLSELISQSNKDPRRGIRPWSQMVPITINDEAHELLSEQGLSLSDVVPEQCFVQLRRAANTSSGGKPLDVTEHVHSDNAALAVAVARLFRLDIAGIDFITPDISRSWRDVGGVVCEVNGQPQFSTTRPDLAGRVIASLVRGSGRIPVVVLLVSLASGFWSERITQRLRAGSIKPGWVLSDAVFSGSKQLSTPPPATFDAVQALLLDTSVGALIVATNGRDWLKTGMPVDRVDLVIVDGKEDQRVAQMFRQSQAGIWWRVPMLESIHEREHEAFATRLVDFIAQRAEEL